MQQSAGRSSPWPVGAGECYPVQPARMRSPSMRASLAALGFFCSILQGQGTPYALRLGNRQPFFISKQGLLYIVAVEGFHPGVVHRVVKLGLMIELRPLAVYVGLHLFNL